MESTLRGVAESKVSVLIADESTGRRRTIRRALKDSAALHVVAEASSCDELLVEVEAWKPRVLVVSDGVLRALRDRAGMGYTQLGAIGNSVRILRLTESSSAESGHALMRDHLWGCLSHSRIEQHLTRAIVAIAGGEMWFGRRQLTEMLRERDERAAPAPSEQIVLRGLTPRQLEVVKLIVRGKTNKEIAQTMSISDLTVKTHVQNILKKCGLRRRGELPSRMLVTRTRTGVRAGAD